MAENQNPVKKLQVEIADSQLKREYGLMDRRSLRPNGGMLFKFPHPHYLSFWMKDTYIPLDIAFLDDDGRVLQIEQMNPLSTRAVSSQHICRYALEVNKDWFGKNKITIGSLIIGEGLTHRNGKLVTAQGIMQKIKNWLGKWVQPKKEEKPTKIIEEPKKEEKPLKPPEIPKVEIPKEEPLEPPEISPEGEYPTTMEMEPIPEGENPEVEYFRDMRGKIKFAEKYNLPMEILYWTLRGHMLPPRKVTPLQGEGYPIKNGHSGEYLVAFDSSPTIQGAGWSIKGMQPKSFILDNIIQLTLTDQAGKEISPEALDKLKGLDKAKEAKEQPQALPQQAPIEQGQQNIPQPM